MTRMDTVPRILIVDDTPVNVRILVRALTKAGYETLEASDGFQAVAAATEQQPDLILLDIMMPGRDGLEVCRILKSRETTAAVPIIFLTAKTDAGLIETAFSLGASDYVTKPFKVNEIKARISLHLQLLQTQQKLVQHNEQLAEVSKALAETNVELARAARTDPLTQLLNRGAWEESATLEHTRWQRHGRGYCILMIDLDYFKLLNDSMGHSAGDDSLRRVAQCCSYLCRSTDVVGRYGGEEFVVLSPETDPEAGSLLAKRIRKGIFDLGLHHPASRAANRVTASVGVAGSRSGSWEDALSRADEALYAAKRDGRNRICVWPPVQRARPDPTVSRTGTLLRPALRTTGEGTRVLVVDDNVTNRRICRVLLEKRGYRVREAIDGSTALAEVKREIPDLILMDVMMPNMDGLDCTRQLKANPDTRTIPVIMVSARPETSDITAGLDAGADEYLTKPIQPQELLLRVRSVAERHRSRQNLLHHCELRGEQTRVLSLLLDFCRTLGATDDLDSALEQSIDVTVALTGCRRVSIMLPDADRQMLHIAKSVGADEEAFQTVRVAIGESIAGRVFESGIPVVVNTEQEIKTQHNTYESPYFASAPLACAALGVGDHIVGVLNMTDRVEGREFEPRELEFVGMIASIAATAINGILTRLTRDEARDMIMVAFAKLAERRDSDTGRHVDRVTAICLILAEELRGTGQFQRQVDDAFMRDLERAVPLHDIGKVAIPDRILLKPTRLTGQEMAIMQTHAEIGADTIRSVRERAPDVAILATAEDIAASHHEWFDGSGYPRKLQGDAIPLAARIVAVADVYDALTSRRVYKDPVGHAEAVSIILKSSGTQFAPAIVDAFMRRRDAICRCARQLGDDSAREPEVSSPETEPDAAQPVIIGQQS